jgi:YHS domain-containing protein
MQSVLDPVCGMSIDPETAAAHTKFEGRDYYFCSTDCLRAFERSPESYRHADTTRRSSNADADPPFTKTGPMVAPKFGSAGSGGGEYEPLPGDTRKPH